MSCLLAPLLGPLDDDLESIPLEPFCIELVGSSDAEWATSNLNRALKERFRKERNKHVPYDIWAGPDERMRGAEPVDVHIRVTQTASPWTLVQYPRDRPHLVLWHSRRNCVRVTEIPRLLADAFNMNSARVIAKNTEIGRCLSSMPPPQLAVQFAFGMPCEREAYIVALTLRLSKRGLLTAESLAKNPRCPIVSTTEMQFVKREELTAEQQAVRSKDFVPESDLETRVETSRLRCDMARRGYLRVVKFHSRLKILRFAHRKPQKLTKALAKKETTQIHTSRISSPFPEAADFDPRGVLNGVPLVHISQLPPLLADLRGFEPVDLPETPFESI